MSSEGQQIVNSVAQWFIRLTDVEVLKQRLVVALIVIQLIFIIGQLTTIVRQMCYNMIAVKAGNRMAQIFDRKLTFLGVVHHEFSHALMVLLQGAKLDGIRLTQKGDTLGAVFFRTRGNALLRCVQYCLVQIGPIIFGTISITVLCNTVVDNVGAEYVKTWAFWVQILVIQQVAYHMQLQKQDVKNMLRGIIPQALIFICLLCMFDFNLVWLRVYVQAIIYAELLNIAISFLIQSLFGLIIRH